MSRRAGSLAVWRVLWLALACGQREAATVPVMRLVGPPLLTEEIELSEPISSEGDGFGFAIASSVQVYRNGLVVLETGNDRLVRFDERFRPVAHIGRKGSGPGELRGAVGLGVWQDEFAVAEVNNARVTVFRADGTYLRSFGIPHGYTEVGYGPDGTVYVSAYDGKNFLLAADRSGTLRSFGARPFELYPEDVLTLPTPHVEGFVRFAVTDSGTVYIYDPYVGGLVAFDQQGRRIGLCALPGKIRQGLLESSTRVAKDFGGSSRQALPSVTGLSVADDGRLLLTFPNVGAIGLLVSPEACEAQEIRWGPGLDPRFGGFDGVVRDGVFYRLGMDDLRLFRLVPR